MTMLTTFAPPARQTVIRAGLLASEGGTRGLSDGYFLLALAESQPLTSPVDLGVTAAMVRDQLGAQTPRRHDGDLLAALGIDLDEVRRRALGATPARRDDPARWRLHRSRVRPLCVTLTGPAAEITLNEGGPEGDRGGPVGQPPRPPHPDRPRRPALGPARRCLQRIGPDPPPRPRRPWPPLGRPAPLAPISLTDLRPLATTACRSRRVKADAGVVKQAPFLPGRGREEVAHG